MTRHFMLFKHCFSCLAAQFGVISSPAATCDANYVDYFSLFALFAFVPLPPRIMEFVAEARELSFPPLTSAFSLPSRILFPSPPIAVVPESASFLFPIIRALAFTFPLIWRAFAPVS